MGFETDAQEARSFELDLAPDLLQTEDYVREVHRVGRNSIDSSAIDKSVAARLERQRRLTTEPRLKLRAVIAEEALRHPLGSPKVMKVVTLTTVSSAFSPLVSPAPNRGRRGLGRQV